MSSSKVVAPGEAISEVGAAAASHMDGSTFIWAGRLHASVGGTVSIDGASVVQSRKRQSAAMPAVGDVVTCRVSRINPRQASVDILCVCDAPLREPCSGLVRREDVRPKDLEAVEIYRSFRPNDIVLAKVISLGDSRSYFLTTNEPELGVVLARSADGAVMKPISHNELECPVSAVRERRKVAKPAKADAAAADAEGAKAA